MMPYSLISLVSAMTLAACSRALDGMQPTLRHTPPSVGPRSTSTTFLPRSAARNAAVYPPGPAPRTSTSAATSPGAERCTAGVADAACADVTGAAGSGTVVSPVRRSAMTWSAETWSPTATRTAVMVPATGAGMSSVALSDSRVISGSSRATRSPAATCTSITGTSMKWPMSGTVTSMTS
jgi:hypothetical protein